MRRSLTEEQHTPTHAPHAPHAADGAHVLERARDGGSKDVASVSTCITLQVCRHTCTSNCLETVSDGSVSRQLQCHERDNRRILDLVINAKTRACSSRESKSMQQQQQQQQQHRESQRQRDSDSDRGSKERVKALERGKALETVKANETACS